jgi:hypothetical protein
MKYSYRRTSFRFGRAPHIEDKTITGADLYMQTGQANRQTFLELVNKWNRDGLLGVKESGIVYVYAALE